MSVGKKIIIAIASELIFTPIGIKAKVAGDDQIEYDGRIFKLPPFVGTYMPAEKHDSFGPAKVTYNGEVQ